MTYKKRAKAGWNHDKDVSNRKERAYEKELIESELKSREKSPTENNPDKFKSSGKRIKKKQYKYPEERKIKKLEKRIAGSERFLERIEKSTNEWTRSYACSTRHTIKKDKAKLRELQEKLQKRKEQDEKDLD